MTRNINTLEHVQYSVNRHQQERECFLQTPSFIFPNIFYAIETVLFIQGTCTSPVRGRLVFFYFIKSVQSQLLEVYTIYTCAIKRTLERIEGFKTINVYLFYQVTRHIQRFKFFVLGEKQKGYVHLLLFIVVATLLHSWFYYFQ